MGHIAPTAVPIPRWGFVLAVGHLQSFLPPEALDALVVDHPALPAGLLGGSAPSPSRALSGEGLKPLPQPLFLLAGSGWGEALRGAVLAHHPTCSTLGDPEPFRQHHHGAATALRGQNFPVMMVELTGVV